MSAAAAASPAAAVPRRPGVRVRGLCANGHVVEGVAEARRITADIDCPSCGQRTHCRRIPKTPGAGAAVPPPAPAAGDDNGTTRVVRIADYDATSSGAQDDPGGLVVADVPTEHEPEPAGSDGASAGHPADPVADDDDGERPLRSWWRERRQRAALRSARRGTYQHPLGI